MVRLRWQPVLALTVILIMCLNMHKLLNTQHQEHVTGGIKRVQQDAASVSSKAVADAAAAALQADPAIKLQIEDPQDLVKAQAQAPPPPPRAPTCHAREHAEYEGDLVRWGHAHFTDSAAECCDSCRNAAKCTVWSWCANPGGCGNGQRHHQCWLKHMVGLSPNLLDPPGRIGPDVPWTSGVVFDDGDVSGESKRFAADNAAEAKRLLDLKNDASLPLVYFDMEIKGKPIGRMVFVLFTKESPRAAENFRALCTGEKGIVPEGHEGAGQPYHFKGRYFYRIIDRFIDQSGAETDSIYGGHFKDEPGGLALKHDRKGLLSIANAGPDTNDSHFSLMQGPAPHNDGHYGVFGELVEGWEVSEAINALSRGKPDNQAGREEGALIVDSGQLRRGDPVVFLDQ